MRVLRLVGRAVAIATAMVAVIVVCSVVLVMCVSIAAGAAPPAVAPPAVAAVPGRGPLQDPVGGSPGAAFRWPLAGTPRVVTPFDPPAQPWLPGHRGVDLAASPGASVLAAGAGTVAFAGTIAGVGVVSIDHSGGLRTTYEPVAPVVRRGERLASGERIGKLLAGHPSCPAAVAACLHWGLRRGTDYLDPLALLGLAEVRLLPLRPGDADGAAVSITLVRQPVVVSSIWPARRAGRRRDGRIRRGGCRPEPRAGAGRDRAAH